MTGMKVTLPTLYKKTSTGAIQYWQIESGASEEKLVKSGIGGETLEEKWAIIGYIKTTYGQVGTESPQITTDYVVNGKNVGKKNETTPYEQAQSEAKAKWEKQKKKGYVESIQAAQAGEVDELIEGGIVPMLAQKFTDHAHKIVYPAFVQPKLDGIRCIAIIKDGKCTLWSRTRKPITSMPHIIASLESISSDLTMTLDGELYNHEFKNNFEHIVSMVRQEEPHANCTDVEYHVYDLVVDKPFSGRAAMLRHMPKRPHIRPVSTVQVADETETQDFFDSQRKDGYEGAMIRNAAGMYANKRSYDLQKIKEFDSDEFSIIGVQEGRGKLAGCAIFVCKTSSGTEFEAKMKGDTANLKRYFEEHSLWKGKQLTVNYQGLTTKNNVPRFPVGVAIRDYE